MEVGKTEEKEVKTRSKTTKQEEEEEEEEGILVGMFRGSRLFECKMMWDL